MMDVYVEKLKNQPALCIQAVGDDDAEIFRFSDALACITAHEICDELAEDNYQDDDVVDGDIGGTPCLFLLRDPDWYEVRAFDFTNKDDLRTAMEMAEYFLSLKEEDDESEDSDDDEMSQK